MSLLAVATRTGRAPSEVVAIGCTYCAYCFDEALLLRQSLERRAEQDREDVKDQAKSASAAMIAERDAMAR